MWPFKRKVDPVMPRTEWDAIKPRDAIIFAVATGEHSLWLFPYQYLNWGAEYLGLPRKYHAGADFNFDAAYMMVTACKKYCQDVLRHE